MKINRDISQVARDLFILEIEPEKKRELIKSCYNCIGRIFSFPENLKKSIEEVKKNNLKGDKAYEHLVKKYKEHDDNLASKLASSEKYPFTASAYDIIL